MRGTAVNRASVVGCVLATAPGLSAGVYSAAEPSGMRAGPDGRLVELPYVPPFKSLLEERLNAANPATPDAVNGLRTFRGLLLERLDKNKAAVTGRSPVPQQVAHAVDLIRAGRSAEAVNLLEPRARDRVPDFVALATLAHAHAARGDWGEARRVHGSALFDAEPPTQLPGVLPDLTKRYVELERTYYARWLYLRERDAGQREGLSEQDVLPLFGPTPKNPESPPVRWVNESGRYEPGKLAAAERAKLPADADRRRPATAACGRPTTRGCSGCSPNSTRPAANSARPSRCSTSAPGAAASQIAAS